MAKSCVLTMTTKQTNFVDFFVVTVITVLGALKITPSRCTGLGIIS